MKIARASYTGTTYFGPNFGEKLVFGRSAVACIAARNSQQNAVEGKAGKNNKNKANASRQSKRDTKAYNRSS